MSIKYARMNHYVIFVITILLGGTLVRGQSGHGTPPDGDILRYLQNDISDPMSIRVDSLLVANYYKFLVRNKKESGIPGYRIRIYSESGLGAKEQQQRVRAKFLSYFPLFDAYYKYDEPFFKVYVGDCRTMSEALKLDDRIRKYFPNPIIVPDFITINTD